MEIWIRSQDSTILMNCTTVYVGESLNKPVIWGLNTCEQLLGIYVTEAEATNVLNMIENYIYKYDLSRFMGMEEASRVDPVFQMPEAGFLEQGGDER